MGKLMLFFFFFAVMCFVISVCFGCFGLSAALCVVARRWGMRGGSVIGLGLFFVRYVLTACRCSNCDIILVVVVAFFFLVSFFFLWSPFPLLGLWGSISSRISFSLSLSNRSMTVLYSNG